MIGGMHRIVLFCRNPEASKRWYERVGFRYLHGHGGMHWFAWGDGEIMLHPAHGSPVPDDAEAEPDTKAETDTMRLVDDNTPSVHAAVRDLDGLFERVKAEGFTPWDFAAPGPLTAPVVRPWGEREFELADPDGHRWAFTEAPADDGR